MLGQIILPLIVIFGNPNAMPERLDSGYCGTEEYHPDHADQAYLPCVPIACVPTFCESYEVKPDGSLICLDSDESYPSGHWSYDIGPDQGDLQVTVEY